MWNRDKAPAAPTMTPQDKAAEFITQNRDFNFRVYEVVYQKTEITVPGKAAFEPGAILARHHLPIHFEFEPRYVPEQEEWCRIGEAQFEIDSVDLSLNVYVTLREELFMRMLQACSELDGSGWRVLGMLSLKTPFQTHGEPYDIANVRFQRRRLIGDRD